MLHSRYRSKEDLREYAVHPEHVRVVIENIKPIVDDIMAVDWMSDDASVSSKPGSAMRVTFLKLKENLGENEKAKVLEVIGGIKDQFQSIDQLSLGENFSHDRAKGYTIASIVVLPGSTDLEALDSNVELVKLQKEKVRDSIESVVVVDYLHHAREQNSGPVAPVIYMWRPIKKSTEDNEKVNNGYFFSMSESTSTSMMENEDQISCSQIIPLLVNDSRVLTNNTKFDLNYTELWDVNKGLFCPVEENVLCMEKHHERLSSFCLTNKTSNDVNTPTNMGSSRFCPVLLLKQNNLKDSITR
ncbi:hypothetical protein L1887_22856 [Cichorium endivia]|nr:hypothetical protein L1887_22856 [Cichorium endivia]